MSDTPLRQASLQAIAEELLRRQQAVDAPQTPAATVAPDRTDAGIRRGLEKRQAHQQERG